MYFPVRGTFVLAREIGSGRGFVPGLLGPILIWSFHWASGAMPPKHALLPPARSWNICTRSTSGLMIALYASAKQSGISANMVEEKNMAIPIVLGSSNECPMVHVS